MMGTGSSAKACSFQLEMFAKCSLTWAEQLRPEHKARFMFLLLRPRFAHSKGWTLQRARVGARLRLSSSVLNSL